MRIAITCGYCGKAFMISFKDEVRGGDPDFARVNCPHCNSRLALGLQVRKKGKSAAIKKLEKEREVKAEADLRERYEQTADAQIKPWSSLTAIERSEIHWKLGHRRS